MNSAQLETWRGEFGDRYIDRNQVTTEALEARMEMWHKILSCFSEPPRTICEIGSNIGLNLRALQVMTPATLYAVEPNDKARRILVADNVVAPNHVYQSTEELPISAELAFTSGVLIHVPPDDLLAFYDDMYKRTTRYIVNIEYFAPRPTMVPYRGEQDLLWKRDFGALWLDYFHDIEPVGCGFEWSRMTGLDDLTWWIFEKR